MHIFHILLACTLCSVTVANNSCVFDHPIHGRIDLTSIGFQDGPARFQNLSSNSSSLYTYSFNPCFSFTEDNCRNVAVCQSISIQSDRISIHFWFFISSNIRSIVFLCIGNTKLFQLDNRFIEYTRSELQLWCEDGFHCDDLLVIGSAFRRSTARKSC